MKQVLMSLFFVLILSFGIIGLFQTTGDAEDIVEEEDDNNSNTVILN
ncbi:hypothetical protein [Lentibacillus sp.]|jgi:hypothetical protein|nr:hypothetical protein [Lentibacillus sp.]HLS08419.1 hypothetical protein [Lentibacillus sp.]